MHDHLWINTILLADQPWIIDSCNVFACILHTVNEWICHTCMCFWWGII